MESRNYTPGVGSYKVEEAGSIRGISSSNNIDNQMGSLTLDKQDINISARGIGINLSSKFNSDHLYSTVTKQIARGEEPSSTLMTIPEGQTNFYRFANGWSWNLPYIIIGEKNIFKIVIEGKTLDLGSIISEETMESEESNLWVEGYHVKLGTMDGSYRPLEIAIPEIKMIIICTAYRSGSSGSYEYEVKNTSTYPFKLYDSDGTVIEFADQDNDNNAGFVKTVTNASGKNSLTFYYINTFNNYVGTVQDSGGTITRSSFTIDSADYDLIKIGDLITIRDETRVVWEKKDNCVIEISGGFNFVPTTSDTYYVGSNPISYIEHSDGRCVKFYYYTYDGYNRITTLLSSDNNRSNLNVEDLFINRYTLDSENNLIKIEILDTKDLSEPINNFDTGEAGSLGVVEDSVYFDPLQKNEFEYNVTDDPDPKTDYWYPQCYFTLPFRIK